MCRAWDMLSGRCVHVLRGHTGRINAVRVAADGRTVVTASDDFTARVFDLQTGACRCGSSPHLAAQSHLLLRHSAFLRRVAGA